MLKIAEITNPTGDVFIPGQKDRSTNTFPDRTELVSYQLGEDEIGKDSKRDVQEQLNYIHHSLPYRLLARTTGADIFSCRGLLIVIGTEIASDNSITNTSFFINQTKELSKHAETIKSLSSPKSQEQSFSYEKEQLSHVTNRLHKLSGLDITLLAQIFKVSRATYHRWLRGLPLRKRHRDFVLEILPLLEEAAQRLGSPAAVSTWLLTPTSPGGKKPIDYLAEKQYDLFRGFLLRQRTGKERFRPLRPSERVFQPRKREDIEDIREQLRPHTWYNEDDELNNS